MHSQMAEAGSFTPMPGAFNPHHDYRAGRKSNVFQPPRTPSVSSSQHLSRSTASLISDQSDRSTVTSRKRSRLDYVTDSKATPNAQMTNWAARLETEDLMARSGSIDPGSPMPFVNTRYQLAGGLDTPTAAAAAQYGEDSEFSDIGYRRSFPDDGPNRPQEDDSSLSYFPRLDEPKDSNDLPRVPTLSQQSSSGLTIALEVVGSVVGKVWEFCKAGAFRGFGAGGGTKYMMDGSENPRPSMETEFWQDNPNQPNTGLFNEAGPRDRESTPLPGQYPEEFIESYMDHQTSDASPPPQSSKRRQIDRSGDGLAKNWVVVPNPDTAKSTPTMRPISKAHTRVPSRYTMPTASSNNRRTTTSLGYKPSPRGAAQRRTLHGTPARSSGVSHAGSPALRSNRPASFASPRSPAGSGSKIPVTQTPKSRNSHINGGSNNPSPAAIEAQRWAERKRREEQEADESIRRFNAQLKAMIREGKEALGSKVEVDGDLDVDDEEGVDEDGFEKVGRRGW